MVSQNNLVANFLVYRDLLLFVDFGDSINPWND